MATGEADVRNISSFWSVPENILLTAHLATREVATIDLLPQITLRNCAHVFGLRR